MNDLIFAIEHGEEKNGVVFERWFNGWPLSSDPKFDEIVEDNRTYNTDLFPFGSGKEGIDMWFEHMDRPVAGLIRNNLDLECRTKYLADIPPGQKYIYPILLHGGGMLYYKSFEKNGFTITDRVISDCRDGICKILIHELNEGHGFNTRELKEFIINQSKILQLPISSFGFLDSNYKTPELQKEYDTTGFCMFHWENHSPLMNTEDENNRILEITSKTAKKYHFLCLNRRPRLHRIPLVMHIIDKWKEKSLFSCDVFDINVECFTDSSIEPYGPFDHLINEGLLTQEIYESLPITIDVPMTVNDTRINIDLQSQAYINLTTETMFYEHTTQFFSEKVFKPIIFLQPFILLGPYKSLNILKNMGYKTFDPFINEAYDDEENPDERFKLILKEIDRLSNFSHEQMQDLVVDVSDILIHNLMNIKNRRNDFIKEKILIQQLREWCYGTEWCYEN